MHPDQQSGYRISIIFTPIDFLLSLDCDVVESVQLNIYECPIDLVLNFLLKSGFLDTMIA